MLRVTTGTTEVDVGAGPQMASAVTALKDGSAKIKVMGAQGPPNWDENGARNDPASVWCVNSLGNYQYDQLRYDPGSMTLGGTISCFTFPAP